MKAIKPPNLVPWNSVVQDKMFVIFAAGSIEQGTAEDWQTKLTNDLKDHDEVMLLNPRRDNWDADVEQSIENRVFREQVEWELDGICLSDLVVFYFDPHTKSPITLLELGLVAGMSEIDAPKAIVCCPKGFWRRGNIEIVCKRYKITLVSSYDDLVDRIKQVLGAE